MKFINLPTSHQESWAKSLALALDSTIDIILPLLLSRNPDVEVYGDKDQYSKWANDVERESFAKALKNG